MIFGQNFVAGATVTTGGKPCASVKFFSSQKLDCTILVGGTVSAVDIVVTAGASLNTFGKGYR